MKLISGNSSHLLLFSSCTYYTLYIDSTNHLLLMYFDACYRKWSSPLLLSLFSNCTADPYLEYISNDAIDRPLSEKWKRGLLVWYQFCYSILRQLFRSNMQIAEEESGLLGLRTQSIQKNSETENIEKLYRNEMHTKSKSKYKGRDRRHIQRYIFLEKRPNTNIFQLHIIWHLLQK